MQPITPRPEVEISEYNYKGKSVIIIECETGKEKPYVTGGIIYVRMGANAQRLNSPEEMRDFFQNQNKIFFEQSVEQNFDLNKDFDEKRYENFLKNIGIVENVEKEIVLDNMQMLTPKMELKNAGILFFAKNPEKYFPNSVIRCILFKGNDKRFIADDKLMTGSLTEQYESAIAYLKQKLELRYEIEKSGSLQRIEKLEIPEVVFREAVVNAIVHRDYFEKGAKIHVEIYDDRVEVTNPGGLLSGISEKDFGKRSLSRNPIIFGLFQRLKLVEQIGSGIARMRLAMKEENLPAPEFYTEKMFVAIFSRPVDFNIWIKSLKSIINETQAEILKAIHRNPNLNYNSLCIIMSLGKTTVYNNIKGLKELELLDHIGSDKTGYWAIKFKRMNT